MLQAMNRAWASILGLALFSAPLLAGAGTAVPTAVDVLFERKHLDALEKGTELAYRFERTVSDPKLLGEAFSDDIKIGVNKVSDAGRELAVQIFSGERARDLQTIPDMTGNPLLVVFLDRSVLNMSRLSGAQGPYLKGAFRTALREKATIEPTKIDYAGKTVDGYKIALAPYASDPNASKLQGYEGSRFSFVVSEAVPGHFVELISIFESTMPEMPKLEERITVAGVVGSTPAVTGGPKTGETK